mmetsp:Transcript_21470/g.61327  ORF Transcript_21470/g.61327 Transcript_21470/m.61327 type:complete len:231 (+) Transcript_21470:2074-2766(+)
MLIMTVTTTTSHKNIIIIIIIMDHAVTGNANELHTHLWLSRLMTMTTTRKTADVGINGRRQKHSHNNHTALVTSIVVIVHTHAMPSTIPLTDTLRQRTVGRMAVITHDMAISTNDRKKWTMINNSCNFPVTKCIIDSSSSSKRGRRENLQMIVVVEKDKNTIMTRKGKRCQRNERTATSVKKAGPSTFLSSRRIISSLRFQKLLFHLGPMRPSPFTCPRIPIACHNINVF